MKNVNEFTGAFKKEALHLDDVLGGGETTTYSYQSLTEYHVLNFSVCVPSQLTVALNCDGYDFVAYQSNAQYGYTHSPLMVAIVTQPLQGVHFNGVSDQLSFLNQIVQELQNQFKLLSVNETIINGHPALVINQEVTVSGSHTSALFIENQTLTQLSISFNASYSNAKELTQLILDSFTVSSNAKPTSRLGFDSSSTAQRGGSSQHVHFSWNQSFSHASHSWNGGSQDSHHCGANEVNQGSQCCNSNEVNQDSQWCDSNRGNQDSQYHGVHRGNQDSQWRDSNGGNQGSACADSNQENQTSDWHASHDSHSSQQGVNRGAHSHSANSELNNHHVVSSWTAAVHHIVSLNLPLSDFSHSVNE